MNAVWIVEAKICDYAFREKWIPMFTEMGDASPLHATRESARKAARNMTKRNLFNHIKKSTIYVRYRATKYKSER